MMQHAKKRATYLLIILLGLLTFFGGNVFLLDTYQKTLQAQADGTVLTVQKIERELVVNSSSNTEYIYEVNNLHSSVTYDTSKSSTYEIYNGTTRQDTFAMLNNAQSDKLLQEDPKPAELSVENVLVSFGNEGAKINFLQVTGRLNGVVINTSNAIKEDSTAQTYVFNQALDLKTLYDINNQPFTNLEGKYEYTFVYRFIVNEVTSEQFVRTVTFWLLDENNYINPNETTDVAPKMYNTEKLDREFGGTIGGDVYEDIEKHIENNFFNYNNLNITDEFNPTSTSNLLFPTLVYDASKYNMSYTKQLHGVTTRYTSTFKIEDGVGVVEFFKEGDILPFKTNQITPQDGHFIYSNFIVSDIGDYTFSFKYSYKANNQNFLLAPSNEELYIGQSRDNNVELFVFGYQLYHSIGNNNEAEFKNNSYNLITDYTKFAKDLSEKNFVDEYLKNYRMQMEGANPNPTFPRNFNNLIIPSEHTLVSTNQAPVFLKSYGSLKYSSNFVNSRSFYHYYPSGVKTGTPQTFDYTNNTRFTQNGYYEVVVMYDFQKYNYLNEEGDNILPGSSAMHMQVFAFKIANYPPTVNIQAKKGEVYNNIVSNQYTNADYVIANWADVGVFDVAPTAKLFRQSFDGYNPYTQSDMFGGKYDNVNGVPYLQNEQIVQDGHYTLQIFYGPSTSTSIVYKFTIDKQQISNFKVIGALQGHDDNENPIYLKDTQNLLTLKEIINTPFALDWAAKPSGASINAKYNFTPIIEQPGFSLETLEAIYESGNIFMPNGYTTSNTFNNITYNKSYLLGEQLSSNSVLNISSIYQFTITDQAGNTKVHYLILDNTQAQILQDPPAVSRYNFVPTQTTLTWGTHKIIEVASGSTLPQGLVTNPNLYVALEGKNYLAISLEKISVFSALPEESNNLVVIGGPRNLASIQNNNIRTFERGINFEPSITFYTGLETNIPTGSQDLIGEKIYHTYVFDASNIGSYTNLSFNNIKFLELIMNLDRSQGHAETFGQIKGMGTDDYMLLHLNQGTNRQLLYFNFKNQEDEYEIGSLSYEFYPLNFDTTSENYPYANQPSQTYYNLLEGASVIDSSNDPNLYRTLPINTSYSTKYQTEVTTPGKYIFTRTYLNDINEQETGDKKVRTYTYYVDRYNIIEQVNENVLVGENITLLLGEIQGRDPVVFDTFLISTTKPTVVETNLLPVAIELPVNKYSLYQQGSNSYTSGIGSFDLLITLTHSYRNSSGAFISEVIANLGVQNGRIILPQLYKNGIYDVLLQDRTGYMQQSAQGTQYVGSNEFSFSFEINNNRPTGNFYVTTSENQDIMLINVTSTNQHDLKFVWEDPIDIYSAKIDSANMEIRQQLKGSSNYMVIYKIANGVEVINTYNMALTIKPIGTIIGSEDTRFRYELKLFGKGSVLSLDEATYSVRIQYEGQEAFYVYDNQNFFSNTISITIDRTPPQHNINRLISADTYLTTSQKNTLKQPSSSLNTQNYAFAIGTNFVFTRASGTNPNQDTHQIYYRRYNKYQQGEQNLQSLVPTDANYNDYTLEPTRPRFTPANPQYISFGYDLGAFISSLNNPINGDYYEIIEIDEAGNYTIYTVQLILANPSIEGRPKQQLSDGSVEFGASISRTPTNQAAIQALEFVVDNIISKDLWYTLTIKDNTLGTLTTLQHTPSTIEQNFINQVNQLITITEQQKQNQGNSFEIHLISRSGRNIKFVYNAQGRPIEPLFEDFTNTFKITLPEHTPSTKIISFKVYRAHSGGFVELFYDMNGLPINNNGSSLAQYIFEAGEYRFDFVDNFNREYSVAHIFGIENIKEVQFEGTVINFEDTLYTSSSIRVVYQKQLYTVEITKNGQTWEARPNQITYDEQTGIETILISVNYNDYNLNDNWVVNIINSSGNVEPTSRKFVVYTHIPTVVLRDSLGSSLNYIVGVNEPSGYSTTKPVFIDFVNTNMFSFYPTLSRTYQGPNNTTITYTYPEIDPSLPYHEPGNYTLLFRNALDTEVRYTWSVFESEISLFAVVANVDGLHRFMSPSKHGMYYHDISGQLIDHYFTTENVLTNVVIEKNPDRNLEHALVGTPIGTLSTGITYIYRIWEKDPNSDDVILEEYIAITQIPKVNNFVTNNLYINSLPRAGNSYKTTISPTQVSWNPYHLYQGNYVYVDYYYNGRYVGQLENIDSVNLEYAGIYLFKFYDFAGNTQLFLGEDIYKITLLSEVLYSVNNADPVQDAIFNEAISLKVEQLQEYRTPRVTIVATRNGEPYSWTREGTSYIFSHYGVYTVTLSAEVVVPDFAETEIITAVYRFMIVNPAEAKLSFEYTPQTGYEIVRVLKDGVDVTGEFKTLQNMSSLTRLFISPAHGGQGAYSVSVRASYTSLKPAQDFSFTLWVNNEQPIINSSTPYGSTTTKDIVLTFNKYLIYQQIGESVIKLNNFDVIIINAQTSSTNEITTYQITENNTYLVRLNTASGNTILSFRVVKKAPLNAIAIILIIVGSAVVATLSFIFIRLRTRMKVS